MYSLFHFSPSRVILYTFWMLFFLTGYVSAQTFTSWKPEPKIIAAIDSVCSLQHTKGQFPGMAVAIAYKGHKLWSRGYGYADMENKQPVDPAEDLFRIGSISKTVTASALARLVQQKSIDLNQPISIYYPALPPDKGLITLKQLGGHLGGIRHYYGIEFLSNVHYKDVFAPLDVFIHDTLLFAPGTKYLYSTYGWTLISAVMEKATSEPFLNLIKEEVITPLRLTDLKADHIDSTYFRRVTFYERQDSKITSSPTVDNSNEWAGGGFLCTAEDIARYGFAHVKPGYLKKKMLKEFTTSQLNPAGEKINYGIGFRTGTDESGREWIGHSGGSIGGTSMLMIYPEEDLVVVTLVNMGSADMDELAERIANIILKDQK